MRFEHRYAAALPMTLIGMGPRVSRLEIAGGTLTVTMGWGFRMTAPVGSVQSAEYVQQPVPFILGIGVHGGRGTWAVNGARRPHVVVEFDEVQRARVIGFGVKVTKLHLCPTDPQMFVEELNSGTRAG